MALVLLLLDIFTFVELNCENMFDCVDDSLTQDEEFLPQSYHHWTRTRYWRKLNRIGQEIISCGADGREWALPDMVALCEVENDSVMRDLTRRSLLRKAGYEYLMTSSPDVRGIDVALLYSPFTFLPVSHYALRVEPVRGMRPTRDILYVKGVGRSGDTLHVFVVHAPSRSGGELETRPHRMQVSQRLCQSVDSIRLAEPEARILVAGDFNDTAGNASLRHLELHGMVHVSAGAQGSHGARGTYWYRGGWESIDHVFCSPRLAARVEGCRIGDEPFLLTDDGQYGGPKPRRTYIGPRYQDGFSDHLPLIVKFSY